MRFVGNLILKIHKKILWCHYCDVICS